MYSRRYSPLSSTGWSNEKLSKKEQKQTSGASEGTTKHHKSLDEIVDILKIFTSRCSILLDPFLRLTDFLSTQRTATSATTRPALTILFIRILLVTPVWILLTLPPISVITTRRVVLTSATGLSFEGPSKEEPPQQKRSGRKTPNEVAASLAAKRSPDTAGIRFTFTLFENQRRWLGIGWTSSMLAYERGPWTDEHLNPMPPKEQFELPEVEGGLAKWRWVEGSQWQVEGAEDDPSSKSVSKTGGSDKEGWIFYDNKWRDGRRGQDSWGRYTRRRKWYRDAELVDSTPTPRLSPSPSSAHTRDPSLDTEPPPPYSPAAAPTAATATDDASISASEASPKARRRRWFSRASRPGSEYSVQRSSGGSGSTGETGREREEPERDVYTPLRHEERESEWGVGEELKVGLG
ncbi:MAG: hypothetical protein Q9157_006937 [Trypethelium eluteriae]